MPWCAIFANGIAVDSSMIKRGVDRIIIENGNMKLSFSEGNKFQILDFSGKEGSWFINDIPLWELTFIGKDGVNPQVNPKNGIYKGITIKKDEKDSAELIFTWQMQLSKNVYYDVRVSLCANRKTKLTEWGIEADMPKGCVVSNIKFPILSLKRNDTTKVIVPEGWGVEFDVDNHFNYTSEYASHNGGMQLLCFHQGKAGEAFYYATHDKTASIKNFTITAQTGAAMVEVDVPASEAWTSVTSGTFRLPWKTSIGLCAEGWEKAVNDWYRPFTYTTIWGNKSFAAHSYPKWLLNVDLWLRPNDATNETETWLKKALEYFGGERTACHWYYWHHNQFDVDYPDYFPAKSEFVPMVKRIQKMGTHITPYINGRLWDPASESYKELNGALCSCRKADGTLYTEVYGSKVANTITCPSSETWQNVIANVVDRMQTELGVTGVYIDQICAGRGVPCFAKNHKHPLGGGEFWQTSYRELIGKTRAKIRPDNILTTEENAECFLDLFDVLLMVNTPQKIGKIVPLFPIVYSDRAIYNSFLYFPEPVNSLDFRLKNVMALLWGSQLGWIEPNRIMASEAKEEAEFLKEMVNFRGKQHDIIYGGRFIKEIIPTGDNPMLKPTAMKETPAVRGALWKGKNDNYAILLVNMDNITHKIILPQGTSIKLTARQCIKINM
jgi:hypothetical protein